MLLYLALNLSVDLTLVCSAPVYWRCSLWNKGLLLSKGTLSYSLLSVKSILQYMENTPIDIKIEPISTNFRRKRKKIQILSNLLRHDQMGKKPSHATVPLTPVFVASLRYSWLFGFCISMVPFLLLVQHCREYWIIHRAPYFLAVEWFGSSATPYPPLSSVSSAGDTQEDCESETTLLTGEGGGWRGRAWSRIIRPQERLVLYKSFNTLCATA